MRSAAINFGDGTTASSITAAHQFTKAGTYVVRATVVNSQGIPSSAMATIVVKPQSVAISSPAPNTTTPAASVHVAGTGSSGYKLMAMHIYVDNVLKYRTAGGKANAIDRRRTCAYGSEHLLTVERQLYGPVHNL